MTEREHCAEVAIAFYRQDGRRRPRGPSLADLIERERGAARVKAEGERDEAIIDKAVTQKERQDAIARAERAEAERDAYKAASMLTDGRGDPDGITPAMVERDVLSTRAEADDLRAKLERAEAAAAQMRAALEVGASGCEEDGPDHHDFDAMVHAALTTDVGAGYVSPEAHARAVAEARRQALEEAAQVAVHGDELADSPDCFDLLANRIRALVKP